MENLEWSTITKKVSEIIPWEHNPRKLSAEQEHHLTESLRKFGLVEIPALNLDNTLLAGHQRCKVLMLLGKGNDLIDVRVPNRMLTEEEVKEYNIRSNANTGSWDLEILKSDLFQDIDLGGIGIDLELIGKLSTLEDKFVNGNGIIEELVDEDPLDIGQFEPRTVLGDRFELVSDDHNLKHVIHCGNSTLKEDVDQLMAGETAAMVFTDPPYNVSIKKDIGSGSSKNGISQKHEEFVMASGEMSATEFTGFLQLVFSNLYDFSEEGSIHYICMDWKHMVELLSAGNNVYDSFKQLCVWKKDNGGMGSFYRSKHELIFVFKKGTRNHINNFELGQFGRYRSNVWEYPIVSSFQNKNASEEMDMHPTVKPIEMVVDVCLDCSRKGDIVLDLFLGSSTTIIACEKTGRNGYGQEMSERYCDISINRYIRFMNANNRSYKIKRNGEFLSSEEMEHYCNLSRL